MTDASNPQKCHFCNLPAVAVHRTRFDAGVSPRSATMTIAINRCAAHEFKATYTIYRVSGALLPILSTRSIDIAAIDITPLDQSTPDDPA